MLLCVDPMKKPTHVRKEKMRAAHSTENLLTERKRDPSRGRKPEEKLTTCQGNL